MGTWVKGSFLIRGPHAACRVLTASGTLGFAGAQTHAWGWQCARSWESHAAGGVLGITLLAASRCWCGQPWVCAATSRAELAPQGYWGLSPQCWLRDTAAALKEGAASLL